MNKNIPIIFVVTFLVFGYLFFDKYITNIKNTNNIRGSFGSNKTVEEVGDLHKSLDDNWWVSSGGQFIIKSGFGSTIVGNLLSDSEWHRRYSISNPLDTDDGYHPQNIFRLIDKKEKQQDFEVSIYYKIIKDNLSKSPNRNQSNGLLLMLHYVDANNLYYAGFRVDGTFIVKKKKDGKYYTIFQKQIDGLTGKYDRINNPNLLPHNEWLGLKTEVRNIDKKVEIKVFSDIDRAGKWTEVMIAIDDGVRFGGPALTQSGYVGIRTDFMDVLFDDFSISTL